MCEREHERRVALDDLAERVRVVPQRLLDSPEVAGVGIAVCSSRMFDHSAPIYSLHARWFHDYRFIASSIPSDTLRCHIATCGSVAALRFTESTAAALTLLIIHSPIYNFRLITIYYHD